MTIDSTRFANLSLAAKMKEEVKAPANTKPQRIKAEEVSADDFFDDLTPVLTRPTQTPEVGREVTHPFLDEDDDGAYEPKRAAPPFAPPVQSDASSAVLDEVTQADPQASRTASVELTAAQSAVSKSYRRSRLTQTDRDLLEFLYEFGYASVSQLRALFEGKHYARRGGGASGATEQKNHWVKTGKPLTPDPVLRRLKGLEGLGLVEQQPLALGKTLWFCTHDGQSAIGRSGGPEPKRVRNFAVSRSEHTLMLNQVAASLVGYQKFGAAQLNMLGAKNMTALDFEFVHESYIVRAWNRAHKDTPIPVQRAQAQMDLKKKALAAVREVPHGGGIAVTYPALWTPVLLWQDTNKRSEPKVYPDGKPVMKAVSVTPDLVLSIPSRTAGQGESIAIEVERKNMDVADYYWRFMAYKNWREVYRAVFYVLIEKDPARRTVRSHSGEDQKSKILRAIKQAGCENFVKVVSLKDTDGAVFYDSKTIWEL